MNYWDILGIDATNDKIAIKEAYMDKLSLFHPEEDPEGFQNLRQAYETAIKQCDREETIDDSPLEIWMQKIENLYYTFSKRIQSEYWQELLQDDVCFQIDSSVDASDRLLGFLMDNYRLPQAVWMVLDNQFDWQGKKDELYNKFPNQFIDFIMNEIVYKDTIRFDLFEADDDKDFDTWFGVYYSLKDNLDRKNVDEAKQLLEEIKSFGIQHPDATVLEIRYLTQITEFELARQLGEKLIDTYPNEPNFLYALARVEFEDNNVEKAKQCYEKAVEIEPEHIGSCIGLGDCLLSNEEFDKALQYYEKAKEIYPYNNYIRESIYKCIEGKTKNYEKQLEENPDDTDTLYNLAWGYFDIDELDKCKEIVDKISPVEENKYYDIKGRLSSSLEEYKQALDIFEKWLLINPDEKLYIYKQISIQYYCLKDYNMSLEYCDKILEIDDDSNALNRKADIFNILEKYDDAILICDKAIKVDGRVVNAYLNKANALYNLGRYKEAMDNCYIVDEIYPYFIQSHIIQTKILYYVSEYEQALELVDKVEGFGIDDEEIKLYKARILEAMGKIQEARDTYLSIIDNDSTDDLVYYYYACLCNDVRSYDDSIYYVNKSIKISDDIYKYYLRAYAYRKKKRYSKALDDYDFIIDNEPNSDQAYNNRALVYVDLKEYQKAENDYKKALELNPNNRTVNNNIGEMYERQDMYDKAVEYYSKQLQVEAGDYYYINRGWSYIKLEKYKEAQDDFNSAIEMDPKNPYAYNGLAHTYKEQGEYDEAIKFFEKAIDINSEYIYAYRYISECYESLKQYDNAEQIYTRAIEKFPDDETLYLDRGLLFAEQGKYDNAIKDYNKALELYPDYYYAYNNMGLVYSDLEEYDKALEYYKKAIELYPDYSNAYNNMGLVYGNLKQYNKAIVSYKKAIKIEPDYTKALGNLARLYLYKVKDYTKAVEYFSRQLEISDSLSNSYNGRGEAYHNLGEVEKSKEDYNIAIQCYLDEIRDDKTYACAYEGLAECYEALGNYDKAIQYYKEAIGLANNCENCSFKQCHEAYYKLGNIEEKKGNTQEAIMYYKKAYDIKPTEYEYQEAINNLTSKIKKTSQQKEHGLKNLLKKLKKF